MNQITPRGIRNNNPGNIRLSKDKWQGLADAQHDSEFFTFQNPVYGIRALARVLISYQDKYSIYVIPDFIKRWAPPSENDTEAYINNVIKLTDFGKHETIDVHQYKYLKPLLIAIIWHENGIQPYNDDQIDKALLLAGVEAPLKPLTKTRTIRGARATAGAGVIAAISGGVAEVSPAIPILSELSQIVQENALGLLIVLGILVICSAGYIAWARMEDRKKGLV